MSLQNPWVTYINRSYKSIKASILNRMKSVVPEITDYSESNIFIIIINLFSGLIEQLNYYIDNLARESFITSARRYSSIIKLTRMIDYRVKAKIGAVVDMKITAVDSSGNPVALILNNILNAGIIVKNEVGVEFITQKKVTIFAGSSQAVVGARQRKRVSDDNIGTTNSDANQVFELNANYQDNTLEVLINSQTWDRVETFTFSGPVDRHFIIEVNQDKKAFVIFGDDVHGAIPLSGHIVYATYYTCIGLGGNLEANTIIELVTILTPPVQIPAIDHYRVTNELPSVGGQDEEGLESIRKNASLSLRTLDRAVTIQDHRDICLLVPGVGKADAQFESNLKRITFYIAPDEGGTAPTQLLTDVEDYFENRKMISTVIRVLPTGETKLRIGITATVRFRRSVAKTETDIKEALQNEFGFNGSSINRAIRRSDLIALIDNLQRVDYLNLDMLTTKPFPRMIIGVNQLEDNWYVTINPNSVERVLWRLVVVNASSARLYRRTIGATETFDGIVTIHVADPGATDYVSQDGTLELGIWGTFSAADQWHFNTYPYNQDHVFNDFTIPVYDENELTLTVNSQLGL